MRSLWPSKKQNFASPGLVRWHSGQARTAIAEPQGELIGVRKFPPEPDELVYRPVSKTEARYVAKPVLDGLSEAPLFPACRLLVHGLQPGPGERAVLLSVPGRRATPGPFWQGSAAVFSVGLRRLSLLSLGSRPFSPQRGGPPKVGRPPGLRQRARPATQTGLLLWTP